MLSYIRIKNFKSLPNVELDLRGSHKEPKNVIFIYGENGAGKTNIIETLLFLSESFLQAPTFKNLKKLIEKFPTNEPLSENLITILKNQESQTNAQYLYKSYKTIGSNLPISLEYGFRINGKDGSYYIELFDGKIIKESLSYVINTKSNIYFYLSNNKKTLSPSIFYDKAYRKELLEKIDKYWGNCSFLSIIRDEIISINKNYLSSKISGNFFCFFNWVNKMSVLTKCSHDSGVFCTPNYFLENLSHGTIDIDKKEKLDAMEKALNAFFIGLYSDIKKVSYNLETIDNSHFRYELTTTKLLNKNLITIPFSQESTGTKNLLKIFPLFITSQLGCSVCIDEIDTGIHDLLMENLVKILSSSMNGQLIVTTHNTLLLDSLDCNLVYILVSDVYGNKKIQCASKSKRIQKNNSLKNQYLYGAFDGIPHVGYVDFEEIAHLLEND